MGDFFSAARVIDPSGITPLDNSDPDEDIPSILPSEFEPIDDILGNLNQTSQIVDPDNLPDDTVPVNTEEATDIYVELLKRKGISDPNSIQFEEEDGTIVEKNFLELSPEEQLEILSYNEADSNYGLEDHEVEAVNFLRENNMTIDELAEYYKNQGIEEYKNSIEQDFNIDSYSDEELYVLDLKSKFEDLTDDELKFELDKSLENPDLFKKKIDKLRNDYKQIETLQREAALNESISERNKVYEQVKQDLITVAESLEDMHGLILDPQDKEDVIRVVTDRDLNGKNSLVKALDNPDTLFKLSWFLSKGDEAFNTLHAYYKKQIDEVSKSAYNKGKEEALKGTTVKPVNSFPVNKPESKKVVRSIHDLNRI